MKIYSKFAVIPRLKGKLYTTQELRDGSVVKSPSCCDGRMGLSSQPLRWLTTIQKCMSRTLTPSSDPLEHQTQMPCTYIQREKPAT